MESTGERGRIQISGETAELLRAADKGDWFEPRAGKVTVKGKGELQTYWLHTMGSGPGTMSIGGISVADTNTNSIDSDEEDLVYYHRASKHDRLIKWNAELLCKYLKLVVARRKAAGESATARSASLSLPLSTVGNTVRDHVSAVIPFPEYQSTEASEDPGSDDLDSKVSEQVHVFVQRIAAMYNDHAFHNFEHASHMTMSVSRFLSRLVSPNVGTRGKTSESDLHENTCGLSSNPMMQFAMVFSAIIHDVDHAGVVRLSVAYCFASSTWETRFFSISSCVLTAQLSSGSREFESCQFVLRKELAGAKLGRPGTWLSHGRKLCRVSSGYFRQ